MDTICKFLNTDICELLRQLLSSLCYGSCNKDTSGRKIKGNQHGNLNGKQKMENGKNEDNQKECFVVNHASYTIRHKYPDPLVTYDGEAMGEPRLIRFSDLCNTKVASMFKGCPNEKGQCEEKRGECEVKCEEESSEVESCSEKMCQEDSTAEYESAYSENGEEDLLSEQNCSLVSKSDCESQMQCPVIKQEYCEKQCQTSSAKVCDAHLAKKCKPEPCLAQENILHLVKTLFPKDPFTERCNGNEKKRRSKNPSYEKQCEATEKLAKKLYRKFVEKKCDAADSPAWNCLTPAQKLRFQWKAITGDELQKTPYDNFRISFMKNFCQMNPRASGRRLRKELRTHWCQLERCQRLPFALQALLYYVSQGCVDPEDHCAVRELFSRLR